jgi:hypothetical protein
MLELTAEPEIGAANLVAAPDFRYLFHREHIACDAPHPLLLRVRKILRLERLLCQNNLADPADRFHDWS